MNKKRTTKTDLLEMNHEQLVRLVLDLTSVVHSQRDEIDRLQEIARLRTAEKYVPSTEQMGYLFEELELLDSVLEEEVKETLEEVTVAAHTRQQRKRLNACIAPANTPIVDVYHDKDAPATIVKDGIIYDRIEDKIIDKLAIIPRQYAVERNHYPQYRAREVEAPKLIIGLGGAANIGGSPSLVANIIVSKFDDHLPLYRQEEIFRREGIFLSRQKLASWVITYYDHLLPFAAFFKRQLYESNLISKDETKIQVDRKSTRLNSSHVRISYAVFCLKKKTSSPGARSPARVRVSVAGNCFVRASMSNMVCSATPSKLSVGTSTTSSLRGAADSRSTGG